MVVCCIGLSEADSSCSDGEVGLQSTSSSGLLSSLTPLFSAGGGDSTRCSSSDSYPQSAAAAAAAAASGLIPVAATASCAAPFIPGNGLLPVAPALFPFLPLSAYFTPAQGPAIAPVMMAAVDLRSVYGQQQQTTATAAVKEEHCAPGTSISDDVDTQELTTRVRDILQAHGLGQKLFGEAVLELSQGSVSELLAKPKPWSLLSAKGREPFLRMRAWLVDPNGIERLRAFSSQTITGKCVLVCVYSDFNF